MGLLEDLNSGKYNLILFGIIFIFIFHQYWNKKSEPMADVGSLTEDKIKELIYKTYLIDVTAIKNLSDIATELQKDKGLTIPGDLTIKGKLNLLPRGTIVAYNQNTPPEGWALCDGSNGSPDLRGRFILSAGQGRNLSNRPLNQTGGEETVTLGVHQMPQHNHGANVSDPGHQHHMIEGMGIVYAGNSWYARDGGFGGAHPRTNSTTTGISVSIGHTGGNQAHENMPPFYVLTYIMKL